MRQKILQIGVARADEDQVRKLLFEFARELHLTRDAEQGVFGGLIAVGRRIERGALNVRVVIGAARRDVDEMNVEFAKQREEA